MSFTLHLKKKGLALSTIKVFVVWQLSFEAWAKRYGKCPEALNTGDLLEYLESEKGNLQVQSMQLLLKRISYYYSYLGVSNPLEDFKLSTKKQAKSRDYLKLEELIKLEELHRLNARIELESKVLLSILVYQGLATKELPSLRMRSVNLSTGSLDLVNRSIPLVVAQIALLQVYIADKEQNSPLFKYANGARKHYKYDHLKAQIRLNLQRSGLNIKFKNLGQLRASRIALWIKREGILQAQYYAGHRHLSSTQAYEIEDLSQLRSSLIKAHPMYKK